MAAYNYWVLMEDVTVAVKKESGWRGFDGYVVDAKDKSGVEKATNWATDTPYDRETSKYLDKILPDVHTFKNEGFTAKILDSAGGSSQGGRLSFWSAEIEKDGVKFTIGVNDAILADLIRNSTIVNGVVQEKVMFARKGGQPGLIHEGMQSYKDAKADMDRKAALKSAKKTTKWEVGGVYTTLTQTDVCLGFAYDTMEEVEETDYRGWSRRMKLVKREKPVPVTIWKSYSEYYHKNGMPKDLKTYLKEEIEDRDYIYFSSGKPPARNKSSQLITSEEDNKVFDKMLSLVEESRYYSSEVIKGRYVRELKK
jgi:hypothetical protein